MLDCEKKNNHEKLIQFVLTLEELIKKVGYVGLKEKAILASLRLMRRLIKKDERVYIAEEKTKKRVRLTLVMMVTILVALVVDQTFLNILQPWILSVYGYIFLIFIMISYLVVPGDRES